MLRRLALTSLLLLCGCPDSAQTDTNDASVQTDGGASALAACTEQPSELPRPPTNRLPCELIPRALMLPSGTP